jgi:glycosyltransferase involved in cell wall biosynthesis
MAYDYSDFSLPRLKEGANVALAHHWMVSMGGGEKLLAEFAALFPGAPIHTLIANRSELSADLLTHPIVESALRKLPKAARHYKKLLPLFPTFVRGLKLDGRPDLLLSSDASVIKGISTAGVPHVCYCHSPARYLWDKKTHLQHTDLGAVGKAAFGAVVPGVRRFDYKAAQKVDHFIANSLFAKQRIQECYGREAAVIHPPVAVDDFRWDGEHEDFYLVVSELASHKRIDLAVDAFNKLDRRLVIIGSGAKMDELRSRARSNITFLGHQSSDVLKSHMERCRALIFPGIEDFGITPVEAQAAGRAVIAYGEGGVLETVLDGLTGLFFKEQTVQSLADAVKLFEKNEEDFRPGACRRQAEMFSREEFRDALMHFLTTKYPALFDDVTMTGVNAAAPASGITTSAAA